MDERGWRVDVRYTRTETAGKRSSCTASQATTWVGEATFCLQNKVKSCLIPDGETGIRD